MNIPVLLKRFLLYVPNNLKIKVIHRNYTTVLKNLQKDFGKRKLKVCFFSTENSKWVYQSLYKNFENSEYFEPIVIVTLNRNYALTDLKKLEDNFNFFKSNNMNVQYGFKDNKHIPVDKFNPDIVFLEEPWDIASEQDVYNISKCALCCYCSYGSGTTNGRNEYNSRVFKQVWKYFLDNNVVENVLTSHGVKKRNLVVTGSIKLDAYRDEIDKKNQVWQTDNFRIIYAPHFSFSKNSILKFGTFDKYYKIFLDFAKSHPEIEFVFKPHPNLKKEIIKEKLMSENEAEKYYLEWKNLKNTHLYEKGNYFDIFKGSDMMVTDCNSFLTEYLPTQKPLLQLISSKSVGLNDYGKEISQGYYKIHSIEELQNTLNEIIFQKHDILSEKRKNCLTKLIIPKQGVSQEIFNIITKELQVKL